MSPTSRHCEELSIFTPFHAHKHFIRNLLLSSCYRQRIRLWEIDFKGHTDKEGRVLTHRSAVPRGHAVHHSAALLGFGTPSAPPQPRLPVLPQRPVSRNQPGGVYTAYKWLSPDRSPSALKRRATWTNVITAKRRRTSASTAAGREKQSSRTKRMSTLPLVNVSLIATRHGLPPRVLVLRTKQDQEAVFIYVVHFLIPPHIPFYWQKSQSLSHIHRKYTKIKMIH